MRLFMNKGRRSFSSTSYEALVASLFLVACKLRELNILSNWMMDSLLRYECYQVARRFTLDNCESSDNITISKELHDA
jgi:hypothetical protein